MRKLRRISHFLHTEFGSKVIARRLGPRRGPTRVFSNRDCARPAVSRSRVPCDMWPKTPLQHCVAVFSRNPIPAIIAALTFHRSLEPPPSWSSLPPIFRPPSDAQKCVFELAFKKELAPVVVGGVPRDMCTLYTVEPIPPSRGGSAVP